MDTLRFHRSDGFRPFDTVVSGLGDGAALSGLVDRCEAQRAQGDAMDALLQRLLRAEFLRLGLFDAPGDPARLDSALRAWFDAACQLLAGSGLLRTTATGFATSEAQADDLEALRAHWHDGAAAWPLVAAHWRLADAVLVALPDILAGRRPATAVLFPDGGLGLVQDVYGGNPVSDYFNGLVAEAVAIAADAAHAAGRTLRILEIGAGTGGTSRVVFDRLHAHPGTVAEYCYTDVSRAFLLHARETHAPSRPWLRTALFDVERDATAQALDTGTYDLVLATNVLHATRHIRRTLRHAKALLRNGGLLVLNEMSTNGGTFTHLTFGLTPGWWLFEDPALRLPGGPGLAPTAWATALRDEGFPRVAFPASARHDYGLQLVIAESNGMVRGTAAPAPQIESLPAVAEPAPPPPAPAPVSVSPAIVPRSQAARLDAVRRAVLEELRHCLMLGALPEGDEAFADLGLDSIVGVVFVRRLNERLGITLDHNATFDHSNATKLARHVLAEHAVQLDAGPATPQRPMTESIPAPAAVAPPSANVPVAPLQPVASPAPRAASGADGGIVPIAVVGMSGVFAQSEDLDALWTHLAAGRDLVVPFPRRGDDTPAPGIVGGFLERVDEFDALFFAISGQEATWMDPQQRLFLQECWRALEDAGYAGGALDGARCGVYVGGAAGDYPALFGDDYAPQALWGNLGSLIASRISYFLNLRGPALVIDTACSSSLVSLHLACRALSAGEIDAALAGGVFMLSTSGYFAALQRAGMFSASGRCRTFDAAADGFVPAEGAGAVLLRRLDDALADGDHIHGVIRGSGMNQDGASNGITAPSAASQEQLETAVYAACGLDPRRLQMIEAHGTGTVLGDPIEHSALCRAFRRHTDAVGFCAIGSIKTNLGHAQSAAGIAGVLKVLLALRHRRIPPSLHFDRCNPAIDFSTGPFFVNTALRDWPRNRDEQGRPVPRCAAVSSFGISGTNAHLVIEEAPERTRTASSRPAHLVALSARTEAELKRQVERLLARCEADAALDCGDLAYTLLTGRRHFAERLACVVEDRASLVQVLRRWQAGDTDGVHRSVRGARGGDALAEPAEQAIDACLAATAADTLRASLSTLADLHVRGATIDFAPLFAGSGARRVPLPTYPLLRDRYWVPASKRPSATAASLASVGTRLTNTSTFDGIRFTVRHDGGCDGADSLPMRLREALAEIDPAARDAWRLHDLRWGAALPATCDLHLVLYPDGADGSLLEAHALAADGTRTVFLQARAERRVAFDAHAEDAGATPWRPLPDHVTPAGVFAAIIAAAGGGMPTTLDTLEGRGDWHDAQAIRVSTHAGGIDAAVRNADGAIIGRVTGLSIARPAAGDWLLLGGDWQARACAERPATAAGESRLLLRLGAGEDSAALAALAADGIAVLRFESCDGPGFVRGCTALLAWCRDALATRGDAPLCIQALVDDMPAFEACAAGLAGFLRSAMSEQPAWRGQVIRIDPARAGDAVALRRLLDREAGDPAIEIRHRGERREVRALAPLPSVASTSASPMFREGGTYLVAGGAGGLGLLLAEALAARLQRARVILTGRSTLEAARAQRLAALRREGFTVDYRAVAVEDADGMRALLRELAADGITGVVHAAGALRDGWLARKTDAELAEAMTAKVVGAEVLDTLIGELGLAPDWFVLFSSITGEYGNAGQADYAAANAYLRGFAERRQARVRTGECRGHTLAIDWPLWRDGGMSVDAATDAFLRRRGLVPLETAQGMALLANATTIAAAHAVALFGDAALLRRHFLGEDVAAPMAGAAPAADSVPEEELRSRVEGRLVALFAAIALLPPDRIDPGEALVQYGIDSLMVVQLNEALETAFGALPRTLMFEHRTLAALAEHLCVHHRESASRWCGLAVRAPAVPPPVAVEPPAQHTALVPFAAPGFVAVPGGAAAVREPIAIIGLSGRYPGAPDLDAFWDNLCNGVDAVGEIPPTRWDVEAWQAPDVETAVAQGLHYSRAGAFLEDFDAFDPLFFRMSPADAYDLNPQERLFLESCWTTLEDAGYAPVRLARQHGGRVGVFAGVTKTGYELHGPALWANGKRGYPHTSFASIANRVSYLLDLNGPSMPVDTMCSASLTAIHEACEHLLRDECELALAGGVNLYLHPANYLLLCGQRMLSPTGRCHSFGADGDGFVPGEGVGTVLLKRLSAAQRDGDPIRALIRGTAVNHDGRTNGYTVPNPAAQAALVRAALARAGVDARDVSCIEAHGTGTRLGDPIEIAGLARAFAVDTADTGFCAIGSLKSNIGHLEAAAGIAGLTKLVLQLQHGELVPSLHASTLNPDIDFATTPFRVQRTRAPWTRPRRAGGREGTRIAGISSFGAGGANAHAVLEEYVETRPAPAAAAGPQLILLSARDDARLAEVVDRLLRAIESSRDVDLPAIAWTLQVGREAMEARLALTARDIAHLRDALRRHRDGEPVDGLHRGTVPRNREAIALFESDEDLRAAVAAWLRKGKHDRLLGLWVKGLNIDWETVWGDAHPRCVPLPGYPFAREHYWIAPGASASTATTTSVAALHPLLHENCSGFSSQRFRSRFTGREGVFADHRVQGRRLLPGVASLEMAREAVARSLDDPSAAIALRDVVWLRPVVADVPVTVDVRLDVIDASTIAFAIVAGEGADDAVCCRGLATIEADPAPHVLDLDRLRARCARPGASPEDFYTALAEAGMVYGPHQRGLEALWLGDGEALARLALPAVADATGYVLHPSLLDAALQATAALAEAGNGLRVATVPFALDAAIVHAPCAPQPWAWIRASSTSGEAVRRLDIDLCDDAGTVQVALRGLAARRIDRGDDAAPTTRLLVPRWTVPSLPLGKVPPGPRLREVLFCGWPAGRVAAVAALMPDARCHAVASEGDDVAAMFDAAVAATIGTLRRLADPDAAPASALLQIAIPDDRPLLEGLSGLLLTAGHELPSVATQCVRLPAEAGALVMSSRLSEAAGIHDARLLRVDATSVTVRDFVAVDAPDTVPSPIVWRQRGVYWIAGGAGGLGLHVAEDIVARVPDATVLLTGRRPAQSLAPGMLDALRDGGATVEYHALDLTDADAVAAWTAAQVARFGRLDGVIHAAGELRDGYLVHKPAEDVRAVLAAKVAGTLAIDAATRDLALDVFVLFASLAGAYGNAGQGDYAAGNAFLDAFAAARNREVAAGRRRGRTVSIDWPLWAEGGMRTAPAVARMMRERHGLEPLDAASGLRALHRALAMDGADQVVVLHGRERVVPAHVPPSVPPDALLRAVPAAASVPVQAMTMPETFDTDTLRERAERHLAGLLVDALKMDPARVDPRAPLEHYGIDSIKVMDLTFALERHFGTLSKTLFFEYQTIADLTGYFVRRHPERLAELLGVAPESAAKPARAAQLANPSSHDAAVHLPRKRAPGMHEDAVATAGPIAIVGVSGRYPMAADLETFWEHLRDGRDCVTAIPAERWDHARYFDDAAHPQGGTFCRWGGFLDGVAEFDPLFFRITPLEATYVDPQERLFLQCAFSALEDAGHTRESLRAASGGRVGVYVGVMYEEYPMFGVEAQRDGRRIALTGSPASIANRVSYFCNFSGPSMAVDSMCSSSLTTLHLACQSLRLGECEAAIAGGVNVSLHPNKYILLEQGHFASSNGRCESFGRGGDGYVPGEGVGAVLLRPLARAVADGDHIHGVILGSALNHGGKTNGYTVPNPNAQGAVIAEALAAAGVPASRIGYIEAHGTGTALGDPIEIAGLLQAFEREPLPRGACPIGSVKSNIGHCESAAGIAGLSKVLLQMRHGRIAPSLHSDVLNPAIDFAASPFFVPQTLLPWPRPVEDTLAGPRERPRIAGISSFGAGGANAHVIVAEHLPSPRATESPGGPQAILLSARTRAALEARARDLLSAIERGHRVTGDFDAIVCTLQLGREAMAWRAGFVAADLDALAAGLRDLLAGSARIRFGEVRADSAPATIDAHDLDRNDPAALVAAWVDGADVPWRALRGTRPVRRVPLPTYPFERTVYWADVARIPVLPGFASPSPASAAASASHTAPDRALVRSWRPSPLPAVAPFAAGQVFVLATPALADVCAALALRAPGLRVRSLMHGGDADFLDADACEPLLDRFDVAADVPVALLDLTALDTDYEAEVAPECGKWRLLQGFVEHHARSGALVVQATCGLADARGGVPTLQGARTVGLYRALGAEYGRLRVCSVDLDPAESAAEARAGRLLVELGALASGASADSDVCLHGERRLVAAFEARPLPAAPPPRDDVVLITGGTGGIGSALAAHLVAAGTRAVAVIGREPLPPPADWPSALRDDPDPARRARLRRLQALVDAGARVRHACVPLSDAAALADEIAAIEAAFGPIATVYHCAGSGGATPAFVKKPIDEMRAVVMPKTVGLRALEAAFADRQAPRFVLCASVSGAVPALGAGQVDYAMANAYLDHVVARRRALGHSGDRAVQWPLWREVGMAVDATPSPAYRRSGLPSLDTPDGLRLFDAVLACDAGVLMPIGRADVDPQALLHPVSSPIATPAVSASAAPAASVVRSRRPAIAAWLRSVFVAEFGLPEAELQESRPFVDYGVDSIFVVQAVTRMQRESGRTIDPALLFEHDTLGRLADHLDADATFDPAFLTEVPHDTASVPQTPAVEIMASPVAAAAATGDAFADPQAHAAIAVVGLACRLPGARDREAYWRLLADGVSAIGPVPAGRWQVSEPGRYLGGWVEDVERFDPEFFGLHPDDARVMDPQARLVLEEALAALCDAGYRREDVSGARAGVYIGGRARLDATALDAVFAAPNPILGIGQNYLATNVSRLFNLTGPSLVVDTACSSGVTGIALAVDALRAGQIDLALAGAVSLLQDPVAHDLFAARNILSPDGRFRLFERQAGGEVLGEGAGLVVLKRLADAQRDGDHVRAVIRAIALNNDGRTLGPGSPNLAAQRNVLRQALEQAGATAADVGYIEVNGGGSPVTDSIEIKALSEVYGLQDRSLGPCHVGSIKPNVSHLLLTSGIASFIRCVLSLEHRRIPPFLSAHDPFAFYDFASSRIVFDRAVTDWDVPSGKRRLAAMSSFADGGTNCHVLIEEAPPAATARASLPLPPMQRRSMVPIVHAGSVSAPRQLPAEKREEARGEPSVVAMENFWGRYVDTTV